MSGPVPPAKWRPLALVALLGWPGVARGCEIRLTTGASDPWQAAVAAVSRRLAAAPPGAEDCGGITVDVRTDGAATLRFSTRDGRVAERELTEPGDLGPLVEALVVSTNQPAAPEAPASVPAVAPAVSEPPVASRAAPEGQLLATAATGARLSSGASNANVRYLSPAIVLGGHVVLGRWEVGGWGEWGPFYRDLQRDELPGFAMSSVTIGLQISRRAPLGWGTLRYGPTLGIAQVNEEADATVTGDAPVRDRAQMRLGAHVGASLPERSAVRFTVDLRGDAVVRRSGRPQEKALPPQPGFGALLTLGVEGRVL